MVMRLPIGGGFFAARAHRAAVYDTLALGKVNWYGHGFGGLGRHGHAARRTLDRGGGFRRHLGVRSCWYKSC